MEIKHIEKIKRRKEKEKKRKEMIAGEKKIKTEEI
jgi:hypothetical protein